MSLYRSAIPSYKDMFLSPLSRVACDITHLVFRKSGLPAVEHMMLMMRYSVPSFHQCSWASLCSFGFLLHGLLDDLFQYSPADVIQNQFSDFLFLPLFYSPLSPFLDKNAIIPWWTMTNSRHQQCSKFVSLFHLGQCPQHSMS